MRKYKICEGNGFYSVWILTDYGMGYGWDPVGKKFGSRSEAEKYVCEREGKGIIMSPAEKAKITRRMHEERRKQKEQETSMLRETMVSNLLAVLNSGRISPEHRLEATKMLYELTKGG